MPQTTEALNLDRIYFPPFGAPRTLANWLIQLYEHSAMTQQPSVVFQ